MLLLDPVNYVSECFLKWDNLSVWRPCRQNSLKLREHFANFAQHRCARLGRFPLAANPFRPPFGFEPSEHDLPITIDVRPSRNRFNSFYLRFGYNRRAIVPKRTKRGAQSPEIYAQLMERIFITPTLKARRCKSRLLDGSKGNESYDRERG